MKVVVARLGRPHGLSGQVALDVRTDNPSGRLLPGAEFATDRAGLGRLTLESVRQDAKGWLARFAQIPDRTAAEAARGTAILIEAEPGTEADAWYPHELAGLPVILPDGSQAGTVAGIERRPAQDLLRVAEPGGGEALVPLVRAIVTEVDLTVGRVLLDPPRGLLAAWPAEAGDT
jgi:16S rRNA processing protein RimM